MNTAETGSGPVGEHDRRIGPDEKRMQGHWLLARMGKRVLRPGGVELSRAMVAEARPTSSDRIVEFGPGLGHTARVLLAANPREYVGVDPNPEGAAELAAALSGHDQARLVAANALDSGLPDASADLVITEAMLTMHSAADKVGIVAEAVRILAPGGRYAIHELGLVPDDVPTEVEHDIARALSRTIKVGARPLTVSGWSRLLQAAGLQVEWTHTAPMHLLEPRRLIADEGLAGFGRFIANVARNRAARERILAMRQVFRTHQQHLTAVSLVARRPAPTGAD